MTDGDTPSARPFFDGLGGRAAVAIAILMLINVVNFIDRQLPFILIEAIKADLRLTDSQIGLLAGLSFAIVYSFASLPLAYLADRWSPRHVLAITLSAWSLLTAVSGLASSFTGLLLARMGVAASEAGCNPSAHALIARVFPSERRALVLALFSMGVSIGSMLGLMLGGWINDLANWRMAFFVVGLPGLLLSFLVWSVLPNTMVAAPEDGAPPPSLWADVRYFFALRSFKHMAAGSALYACGSYAINVFASAFLIRVHGLTTAQAGLCFGLAFGGGGLAGTFIGGVLSDVLGKRDPKWRQLIPAIGQLLSFPTALGAWLAPSATESVILLALSYVFGLLYFAPSFAVAQSLATERMRARERRRSAEPLPDPGRIVGRTDDGRVGERPLGAMVRGAIAPLCDVHDGGHHPVVRMAFLPRVTRPSGRPRPHRSGLTPWDKRRLGCREASIFCRGEAGPRVILFCGSVAFERRLDRRRLGRLGAQRVDHEHRNARRIRLRCR